MNKLTKNFNFVEDPYLIKFLLKIEKYIENEDEYDRIPQEVRKTLEYIFNKELGYEGNINNMITRFKNKYNDWLAIEAMYFINSTCNKHMHNNKNIEVDYADVIYLTKSLSILCQRFFLKNPTCKFYYNAYNTQPIKAETNIVNMINDKQIQNRKMKIVDWLLDDTLKIEIPFYQRDYTWNEENIKTLWNDLEDRNNDKDSHYFGVIAINNKMKNKKNIIKIIDGQQRITTSILLLKATYDYFILNSYSSALMDKLKNIFEIQNFSEKFINQSSSEGMKNDWNKIITKNIIDQNRNAWKYSKNYLIFKEEIMKISDINKVNFYIETFINKFEFIELSFNVEPKKEMSIFENLNSKGTSLNEWDLIKNQLYNINPNDINDNEKVDIVNNRLIYPLTDNIKKNDNKYIETFFAEYVRFTCVLNDKKYHNKYSRFPIYNNFKRIFDKEYMGTEEENKKSYEEFLDEIKKYGIIYREFSNKNISNFNKKLENLASRIEYIIRRPNMYCVLFSIFKRTCSFNDGKWHIDNWNELEDCILILNNMLIRREVCDGFGYSMTKPALEISRVINEANDLSIDLYNYLEKSDMIVSDIIFYKNLVNKNTKITLITKIFLELESFLLNEDLNSDNLIKTKNPSVEHIMPRDYSKWETTINNQLGKDESIDEKHKEYLNKLGNFIVIPKSINSRIKNSTWDIKKEELLKTKLPMYSGNEKYGLKSFSGLTDWTFNRIEKRSEAISYIITHHLYSFDKYK